MRWLAENIWYVITIFFVVLVGGGWFLIATRPGRWLLDWMKPTSDKFVPAKVFCEDRQIRDRSEKVGRYVISDERKKRAFYLVHDLLLSLPNSSRKFLALGERSARPIDFHNKITAEQWKKYPSAQRVFIDTTADIRSESSKAATNNFMAMSLSIIALCGALVVVIMGIIIFWQSRGAV